MARVEITETVLRPHATTGALQGVSGATVTVNTRGGGAATVYAASTGSTTVAQPLTTRSGRIEPTATPGGELWVEPGSYDLVVTSGGTTTTTRFEAASGIGSVTLPVPSLKTVGQSITGDGKVVSDAAMTASSAVVTSATAAFTQADVGKIVAVIGAGAAGATLGATIQSVQSAASATLNTAAGTTVTDATLSYGTDDAAAIQTAVNTLALTGGALRVPVGVYMLGSRVIVPAGVQVLGTGLDYANFGAGAGNLIGGAPARSSVWRAGGNFDPATSLVRFGANKVTYTSGEVSPSAEWMVFDGSYLAESGAQTWAARGFFAHCWFGQGNTYGLDMSGQNSRCNQCVVENGAKGTASLYFNANDVKFTGGGEVRNGGTAQIKISGACGNWRVSDLDAFGNTAANANVAIGLLIDPTTQGNTPVTCQGQFVNNNLTATRGDLMQIRPGTNIKVGSIAFNNNRCYGSQAWPNSAYGIIRIDLQASGSELRAFQANDNNIDVGSGTGTWAFLAALSGGTGTVDMWSFHDNTCRGFNQLFASFTPTSQDNNTWKKTGATHLSTAYGVFTATGDGSATTFNIPHGMSETSPVMAPSLVNLTPGSAAARDGWNIGTIDATNIQVVFAAAPANGQSVKFFWEARL